MKRCPVCNRESDDDAAFCNYDGHAFGQEHSQASDATSLSDLISAEAPFEIGRAARLAALICDATQVLHRKGRAVGYLRPKDILVCGDEKADGRSASIIIKERPSDSYAESEMLPEEAVYVCPELAQQRLAGAGRASAQPAIEHDVRSDVFSIGAILYEMLTGRAPFKAASPAAMVVKQILERPRPLRDFRTEIPEELERAVLRALDSDRAARQSSCAELKEEIQAAAEDYDGKLSARTLPGVQLEIEPPGRQPVTGSLDETAFSRPGAASSEKVVAPSPYYPQAPESRPVVIGSAPTSAAPASSKSWLIGLLIGLGIILLVVLIVSFLVLQTSSTPQGDGGDSAIFVYLFGALLVLGGIAALFFLLHRRKPPTSIDRPAPDESPRSLPQDRPPTISAPPPAMPQRGPRSPESPAYSAPPPTRAAQDDTAETIRTSPTGKFAAREAYKRCPSCGTEFPVSTRFCVRDGTVLIEESKPVPHKKTPSFYDMQSVEIKMRCPRCGEDYPANKKFCRFDGQLLVEVDEQSHDEKSSEAMEPVLIGQYSCFSRLGEGGMGVVYKARHVLLDRLSAVKVLLPQTAALLPNAVQMFRREARLASSINHPNSVIIYDYGEFGASLFYLAMEFIPGKSLAEIIHPKGMPPLALPLLQTVKITRQICDALEAAHHAGIVHRDLKPQNVMVSKRPNGDDLVKVVDFGIARPLRGQGDYQTAAGALVGTPAYMSPEQANGIPDLDPRSDVFSLGLMVFEMLGGRLPFDLHGLTPMQQAIQRAMLRDPPPPLSSLRPDLNVSPALDRVLTHALEPDRNRRTQSISLFIQELESAVH